MPDIIGANPDTNLDPSAPPFRQQMEKAGFTFVRIIGENEATVFRSANGNEFIISTNSVSPAAADQISGQARTGPIDSEQNLRAEIELSMAAKAAFGAEGSYVGAANDQSLAIAIYASELTGNRILNEHRPPLDPETKAKMDKAWADMNAGPNSALELRSDFLHSPGISPLSPTPAPP